jgi:hypothetical protein
MLLILLGLLLDIKVSCPQGYDGIVPEPFILLGVVGEIEGFPVEFFLGNSEAFLIFLATFSVSVG